MTELIDLIFTPRCISCGALGLHVCSDCKNILEPKTSSSLAGVDLLVTASEYGGWVREVLISYKSGHRNYAKGLGQLIDVCLDTIAIDSGAKVIPIPTSKLKRVDRGYDSVSNLLKYSKVPTDLIHPSALQIKSGIKDQVGLSLADRRLNLRNAFRAIYPISGMAVIVDDVVTTGSTLTEAARALRQAGASQVVAIAICGSKNWR